MNISLTPELEKYISAKIDSGLYTSVSEVIREALRLMTAYENLQRQNINQLNHAIETGLNELKAGRKILASESYKKLKQKINTAAKSKCSNIFISNC